MITSTANEHVKYARSLARKKERMAHRQFLVEGTRAIEEAERAGFSPALVFFDHERLAADSRSNLTLARLAVRSPLVLEVSPAVFRSLSDTQTPQGLAAVYSIPEPRPAASPTLILVLDSIRDPGNLGTILRTAWAAGVDLVLLAPGCSDPYNPKVVRAGMGAHFWVANASLPWQKIAIRLASWPRIYLAAARSEQEYRQVDWSLPLGLIIGGEAEGASAEANQLATARVSIPMPGGAESLNAAVAAGILLFEAAKGKR